MNDSIRTNKKNFLDQSKKSERINPSSSINMKFLSPSSRKIRLKNKRQKTWKRKEKIKKLEDVLDKQRIILEKEQH